MELIYGIHNLRPEHRGCVATIGAFDGIHLGHRSVLEQLHGYARRLKQPAVMIVFEPLPREYFAPLHAPARLTSFRERYKALLSYQIDRILLIHFTEKISKMTAHEFIRCVFVEGLAVQQIIVGDDLRFGHDRQGDFNLLCEAGRQHGFAVAQTASFLLDGERVSSTRIRQLLEQGNFARVQMLLGRPYSICGKVVVGQQLGRKLGAPTANVELHRLRSALSGVYVVNVILPNGDAQCGVANVGTRPTVDDSIKAILEVHILDFDANLYGKHIEVIFLHKIREEVRFSSIVELQQQIHLDIEKTKNYFIKADNSRDDLPFGI